MQMNSDSPSVWNVRFWCSRNTAVLAWKNRWWHWGGCGTSISCCISPGVEHPFVRCLKEVNLEWRLINALSPRKKGQCLQFWNEWTVSSLTAVWVLLFHIELNLQRCECSFEYWKLIGGRSVVVSLLDVKVYALQRDEHATFNHGNQPFWPEYESFSRWRCLLFRSFPIILILYFVISWAKVLSASLKL